MTSEQERTDWKGRKVGDQVTDEPGVNPYTITKLYGRGGKVQVGGDGNVRVYWGAPTETDPNRVIAHYKPNGSPNIHQVIIQQQKVLSEIFGTQVLLEQARQLPSQGVEEVPLSTRTSLAAATEQLRSLLIPGRLDQLKTVVSQLEEVTRLLTNLDYPTQIAWAADRLQGVLEGRIGRSRSPHLREAAQILAISSEYADARLPEFARRLLRAATEAQQPVLAETLKNAGIGGSISERLAEMQFDVTRWHQQITLTRTRGLAERAAKVVVQLEQALGLGQLTKEEAGTIMAEVTKPHIGIYAILDEMVANPNHAKASRIRANFILAEEAVAKGDSSSAINILGRQVAEFNNWRNYLAHAPNRFNLPADNFAQPS